MLWFISGRALQSLLSLVVVSFVVFYVARLTGDPTVLMLSEMATKEDAARLRAKIAPARTSAVADHAASCHAGNSRASRTGPLAGHLTM